MERPVIRGRLRRGGHDRCCCRCSRCHRLVHGLRFLQGCLRLWRHLLCRRWLSRHVRIRLGRGRSVGRRCGCERRWRNDRRSRRHLNLCRWFALAGVVEEQHSDYKSRERGASQRQHRPPWQREHMRRRGHRLVFRQRHAGQKSNLAAMRALGEMLQAERALRCRQRAFCERSKLVCV